jgi:spore germination cell wall hydrolase CwlJ-like protein
MLKQEILKPLSLSILILFFILAIASIVVPNTNNTSTQFQEETTCENSLENLETIYDETTELETETTTEVEESTYEDSTTEESEIITYYDKNKCVWGDFVVTDAEFKLICTTVFCEAGNQDFQTQYMVALTILNRYKSNFASTIRNVIYDKNAYSVTLWHDFENRGWTEQVEKAVAYSLRVNDHPEDMYFFRTKYYHTFYGAEDYMKSGSLYFSTYNK